MNKKTYTKEEMEKIGDFPPTSKYSGMSCAEYSLRINNETGEVEKTTALEDFQMQLIATEKEIESWNTGCLVNRSPDPKHDEHYFMLLGWREYLTKQVEKLKPRETKKLPQNSESVQMDMFRTFVAPNNDNSVLSNLINIWDMTPKYFVSKRHKYRNEDIGNVKSKSAKITIKNDVIDIIITPAFLEETNGFVAYFPSETEEIIEHVMRKILLEQSYGIHSNKPRETWVKYSIRMVRKELKKLGKTRSHAEILKSIEILSRCNINIKRNGQTIQSGAIFKERIDASSQNYSGNNPDLLSAIQLPEIITTSINKLEFKQYNYYLTNSLRTQLSRWLMRRLSLQFLNAGGLIQTYEIKYSEILKDSCLLSFNHIENRKKINKAIIELVENRVLYFFDDEKENKIIEYKPKSRAIKEITYLLHPNREFVKHMKASNKRNKNILDMT